MQVSERVLTVTQAAVARAVAQLGQTSQVFAQSQQWQALIDSLSALGDSFDFLKLFSPDKRGPRERRQAEPLTFDPHEVGKHAGQIAADILMTDAIPEAATESSCTLLVAAEGIRRLDMKGVDDLAAAIEDLQLRLTVGLLSDEAVDILLQVGPQRAELAIVRLHGSQIEVESDLRAAKTALELLGRVLIRRFRKRAVGAMVLPHMQGRVRTTLDIHSPTRFTLRTAVTETAALLLQLDSQPVALVLEPSLDTLRLAAGATSGELGVTLNLGASSFTVPRGAAFELPEVPGVLQARLPTLTCGVTFEAGQTSILLTHVGLGGGSIELCRDTETLISLDLNDSTRRCLDVRLVPLPDEKSVAIVLEEGLAARIAYDLRALQAELGDEVPATAFDQDSLSVILAGERPTLVPTHTPEGEAALRISGGTLTATSGKARTPLKVPDRHLLVLRAADQRRAEEQHPFLGRLDIVAPS